MPSRRATARARPRCSTPTSPARASTSWPSSRQRPPPTPAGPRWRRPRPRGSIRRPRIHYNPSHDREPTGMHSKVVSMRDAIARYVRDGDTVVIEGFTHLICFAAGHEIIRQRRKDLVLARLTPDLIYDQMIGAGCARKLVFSWAGNPGVGSLHAFRRAVEAPGTAPLEIEEYSHFGMVARFSAGAARLPFWPLRDYMGTDLPRVNPRISSVTCPYTGEDLATVPALNP